MNDVVELLATQSKSNTNKQEYKGANMNAKVHFHGNKKFDGRLCMKYSIAYWVKAGNKTEVRIVGNDYPYRVMNGSYMVQDEYLAIELCKIDFKHSHCTRFVM